jgi:hypothetical protein
MMGMISFFLAKIARFGLSLLWPHWVMPNV